MQTFFEHIGLYGIYGLLLGYFIGSIPFGLVLCRLFGYGDIRNIGSGNIGATNVLRTGNKALAAATLFLDSTKGLFACMIALALDMAHGSPLLFTPHAMFGAALGAVLGHNFPVWLKFKGGKGVAVTLGVFIALNPLMGLAVCALWLLTAAASRISSLSALVALSLAPVICLVIGNPHQVYLVALIALIGIVRHHANIRRLIRGEEPKISFAKKGSA